MKRRILSIVLAGVIVFSNGVTVSAAETELYPDMASVDIVPQEEPAVSEELPAAEEHPASEEIMIPDGADLLDTDALEADNFAEDEIIEDADGFMQEEVAEKPAEFAVPEEETESEVIMGDPAAEELSLEAMSAGESTVRINDENVEHFVFDDSIWDCSVDVTWLGDGEYDLEAVVTDHNGPEYANTEGACYIDDMIHVDGGILADAGITWVKIAVKLSSDYIDEIWSNEVELDVREIYVERHFDVGDMSMLPGWDRFISRHYDSYVENADYPEGSHDYSLEVTDVAIEDIDGENVVRIENSDENGWNLRAENSGKCKVDLTYTDWDDTEGHTYEFYIYVGGDVYGVDVWTDSGSKRVLRGGTVSMSSQASHEQYDAQSGEYHTCTEDEMTGITYEWSLNIHQDNAREQLGNVITVTQDANDPGKAVVSFENVPADWNEGIDVEVLVSIKDGGEDVVAENNYWLRMDESYLEMWPTRIDGDIDVGETTTITPQIRRYPGENGQEYDVLPSEEVQFETEIYDDNAYEITENSGTFTVLRKLEYGTSFRIKAFVKNENGDWEYADDREYWLNEKNYEIRYDIDGNDDIYSDGERIFALDLSNLGDANYEIVPYVGTGEFGEDGFEYSLAEGEGWSYNGSTGQITFYGDELYNMGIDWIDTKIVVMMGGIEVASEQRGFDVHEARYDYHGAFENVTMLLSDGTWYMGKEGNVYVETSVFPDGAEGTYEITGLTFTSEEDEFDTREPISLESDEYNWKITPVRGGVAEMHATVELRVSDGTTHFLDDNVEMDFVVVVGGWRYDIWLNTSTGSDKLQTGGEITLFPEIHGEGYDWQTGEHYDIDTSGYGVRYEVKCTHVDQRIIDEQYDGDFEAAAARGGLWDYTENTEDRSIVLQAKDNAYGIDLEVRAFLIDPETGEDCAGTSRSIWVNPMLFELVLCEDDGTTQKDWNKELPPGGEFVFTPTITRDMAGDEEDPAIIGNPEDVIYTMEWYAGDGDGDPAHIQIQKANGEYIIPGDEVSAADAPFTVKRMVPWNENINIQARWTDEEGCGQNAWRDLKFSEVSYGGTFAKNNDRGDDHFTWYYTNESIDIQPNRGKLDELAVQGYEVDTTIEIGIWDGDEITAIPGYDPVAKGIFTPENGLQVSSDAMPELKSALEAANANGRARIDMRLVSVLGGVTLADHKISVEIMEPYMEILDLDQKMGLGTEQSWPDGQAKLYVEDSVYDTGINGFYEAGTSFDITITDISIDNETDEEFLAAVNEDGTWKLKANALTDHPIPVTITFTGGPEGYTSLAAGITITGDVFEAELGDCVEEESLEIDIMMGTAVSLCPRVKHITYTDDNGTIVESVTELPDGRYTYNTEYYVQNERIVSVDSSNGEITPLMTGTTDLEVIIRVYDENNNECDRLYFPLKVVVSAFFVKLEVPENAVFYVGAGQSYEAAEIGNSVGAQLRIYSMKKPDGEVLTVSQYFARDLSGDGQNMKLSDEVDGAFNTLNVSDGVNEGAETLTLSAVDDEEGFSAQAKVKVAVHPYEEHNFGNWTTAKEASCTEKGIRERICSVCKYKETEDIPALGHVLVHTEAKKATSVEEGNIEYWTCSRCGKVFSDAEGTKEIQPGSTVIGKLAPVISVSQTAVTIAKTTSKTVSVTFAKEDSITAVPSSNTNVAAARISGSSVIITAGKTAGTAVITVTLKSGGTAAIRVTVPKVSCTGIKAKAKYVVTTRSTIDLGVLLDPVYSDDLISYKSAKKKIATVTANGIVKGVKAGKTKITIKTSNNKTKKVTIVVKQGTNKIKTAKKTYSVKAGKKVKLKAKKIPAKSVDKITYSSSDTAIATVNKKGVVTGVSKGEAIIIIQSGTVTKKVKVKVK